MRHGFTLLELMIVIAVIAIIAAIAIPNLIESRISSNEASAASSLKSGVFPGAVSYQAGGYVDADGDGIGDLPSSYRAMSGDTQSGPGGPLPVVPLGLLPATWRQDQPNLNNYLFNISSDTSHGFAAACVPADFADSVGRRAFAINLAGIVYSTGPSTTNPESLITTTAGKGADVPFGAAPYSAAASGWSVYKR